MKRIFTGICISAMLFSASCSASVTPVNTPVQATRSLTPSPTLLPSSATPSPTSTLTSVPPMLTPLPILRQPEEIKAKLFELLQNNGGCQLPCLFEYTPGIVSLKEMRNFFGQFALIDTQQMLVRKATYGSLSGVTFYFPYSQAMYLNMGISSYRSEDQIEALAMDASSQPKWTPDYAEVMEYYLLPQILTNYGEPSQVLILTYRNDRQRPDVTSFPFFLLLLYPDQGFYVKYKMERVSTGVEFLGCPAKSFVSIAVWSPDSDTVFQKMIDPTILGEYLSDYKLINDATAYLLDDFYQVFSKLDNNECIKTPIEIWPNP